MTSLDLDDEIAFQAADAGAEAPADAPGPVGTGARRQEVALADPLTGQPHYVYLFQRPGGSSFDAGNGYVRYERDADADEWIDRYSFAQGDPEQLGSSNTGYGPNLTGTVCHTDPRTSGASTSPTRAAAERGPLRRRWRHRHHRRLPCSTPPAAGWSAPCGSPRPDSPGTATAPT